MTFDSSYTILIHKDLEKSVKKDLPAHLKKVFERKLQYLRDNPRHPSLNTKQLTASNQRLRQLGIDEAWEFRINMGFRCIFYVIHERKEIIIFRVGDHEDVKRHMK